MRVLGFMSGTSLDGVDAAMLDTDGETIAAFGPAHLEPFGDEERAVLVAATEQAVREDRVDRQDPAHQAAEAAILAAHRRAAAVVLRDGGPVDLVGFHGQTVLHRPDRRLTVQLGDAAALADALGVAVVADLRQADLAAGGQGAPLVPVYHAALADRIWAARPVAFLNVGGVANLSWLGADGQLVAFDTGPGNGLIDLMVQARGVGRYDAGGRLAAAGTVDRAALAGLLAADYFRVDGPKSLDRYDFPIEAVAHLGIEDAAATLVAFTAAAVALGAGRLPAPAERWLVCGGGRLNRVLMAALGQALGRVESVDDHRLRGDFIEAEAMAFLAARSVRGLPLTFPGTTGVPAPTCGGQIFHPRTAR